MSRKSTSLLIATSVVVIAAVAFFNRSVPPKNTDVTGAIGTVDKYRSEQITPQDVAIDGQSATSDDAFAQWFSEPGTLDELGNLMGRCSVAERLNFYERATEAERVNILGRATEAERAYLLGRATEAERVNILNRMDATERATALQRVGVDPARRRRGDPAGAPRAPPR